MAARISTPPIQEEQVTIAGADVNLEGRLGLGPAPHGVIITHPHPLYGGTMDNNVVWTAVHAFQARGWTTLRFNFRGVGLSTGAFGDGLAEVADVQAALSFLGARLTGQRFLVGYSFGAAVAGRAMATGVSAAGLIMIAPPIALMDMSFLPKVAKLRLIIVGERDEFCPLPDLEKMYAAQPGAERPEIRTIPGASHFFAGREQPLAALLQEYPLV
ncbi:MAG: alpha/beta hydrolase [Desulfobacca sp.]|uniref:alpha/beta hydrolase n=1 Tax=Desulfobacca sp. TaxID=2067990 RepID=UPI00404A0833